MVTKGIANIGNTCYLNSVLQCLYHLDTFRNYIITTSFDDEHVISKELQNIFKEILSQNTTCVKPIHFLRALHPKLEYMNIIEQNDVSEFTSMFLDILGKETKRDMSREMVQKVRSIEYSKSTYQQQKQKMDIVWCQKLGKEYSDYAHMTSGQLISQILCKDCGKIWHTYEMYQDLSLAIHGTTLEECLKYHFQDVELNDWKCDECNKGKGSIKIVTLWRTPRIFIITLKRFEYVPERSMFLKNNTPIDIPHTFDVSLYTLGPHKQKYKLKSVAFHNGSYNGGHYHALCQEQNNWYHCDDDYIGKLDESNTPNVSHGYMFFYEAFS